MACSEKGARGLIALLKLNYGSVLGRSLNSRNTFLDRRHALVPLACRDNFTIASLQAEPKFSCFIFVELKLPCHCGPLSGMSWSDAPRLDADHFT